MTDTAAAGGASGTVTNEALPSLDDARATAEASWAAVDAIRQPLHDELTALFANIEGRTSWAPGPGMQLGIDTFLDYIARPGVGPQCAELARVAKQAIIDQEVLNEVEAAQPVAAPEPEVPFLLAAPDDELRQWLKLQNEASLTHFFGQVEDRITQRAVATKLSQWAREDGNLAEVIGFLDMIADENQIAGHVQRVSEFSGLGGVPNAGAAAPADGGPVLPPPPGD